MEAIATVNLAHPNGGPPLPAGTPVIVDDADPYVQSHIDAGYLVPVKRTGASQVWDEHAAAIQTGSVSDLGGSVSPAGETMLQREEEQARKEAEAPRSSAKTKGD